MKTKLTLLAGLSVLLTIFLFAPSAEAQDVQTLFDGETSHGGFGGPVVKIGDVAGSTGIWVGGRGGWIISFDGRHSLSIGGGGYGLASNHESPSVTEMYAVNGYGGFEVEYTRSSHRLTHFTISSLIGAGGVSLRDQHHQNINEDVEPYFVFEPGLHAELNVTNFFRIAAGATYRFTNGIDYAGFTDQDFSGINGVLTLKFGKFL